MSPFSAQNLLKKINLYNLALLLIGVFTILKIANITQSTHYHSDEYFSILLVNSYKPIDYFKFNTDVGNPPFYYLMLDNYLSFFPTKNEFVSRSLSIIFLIVSLFFVIKIADNIFKSKLNKLALFTLFSTSGTVINYYTLARPYPLYLTIFIIIIFLFTKKRTNKINSMFIIMLILGMFTHYVFFVISICFLIYFILQKNLKMTLAIGASFLISFGLNAKYVYLSLFDKNNQYAFDQFQVQTMSLLEPIRAAWFRGFVSYQIIAILLIILFFYLLKNIKHSNINSINYSIINITIISYLAFFIPPLSRIFPSLTYKLSLIFLLQIVLINLFDSLPNFKSKKIIVGLYIVWLIFTSPLKRFDVFQPEIDDLSMKLDAMKASQEVPWVITQKCFVNMVPYFKYYLPKNQFKCLDNQTTLVTPIIQQ
ncbi:MAG: hypothetical protein COU63_05035 [Candidatus Pacebacteria bacterium CG10_big_fil_rev_8_21_14_0_10_36_11]|nr:hypothetical protein [Candidatus Pacearchaeota archaeon]OIP73836.1 MAG: hypothetical protein AUK08_04745 [Candidatus Pacebacteria bacterium CG2_30_36_39]PIR64302.1 MAG: hypothetical protein COU63_05035 [Candidatus Pacebacteria bacterium CG10_big_fil_rev_8_21_14_0_10_36_11]PJC42426.1 MAG: hypothetical protein CO040_04485 [Candidatus Pacebacteria bacterium CG_4_9_14_0_2_um_filter_36_8]